MSRNMMITGMVGLIALLLILISGCAKSQSVQEKPQEIINSQNQSIQEKTTDLSNSNSKTAVLNVTGIT